MLHIWRTNNISDKDNTNGQSIMYGQLSSPGGVRRQKGKMMIVSGAGAVVSVAGQG